LVCLQTRSNSLTQISYLIQIDPEDRFEEEGVWPFQQAFMSIDVTACPIERPANNETQRLYYSGKHKCHVQKWECGVRVTDGKICWVSRAFRGPVHDLKIFRESGVVRRLVAGEKVLADKAYVGHPRAIVPYKGSNLNPQQKIHNLVLSRKRIIVERVFGRLKAFRVLRTPWRAALERQNKVFYICCCITNRQISQSPL